MLLVDLLGCLSWHISFWTTLDAKPLDATNVFDGSRTVSTRYRCKGSVPAVNSPPANGHGWFTWKNRPKMEVFHNQKTTNLRVQNVRNDSGVYWFHFDSGSFQTSQIMDQNNLKGQPKIQQMNRKTNEALNTKNTHTNQKNTGVTWQGKPASRAIWCWLVFLPWVRWGTTLAPHLHLQLLLNQLNLLLQQTGQMHHW